MAASSFVFKARHDISEYPEWRAFIEEFERGADQLLIAHVHVVDEARFSPRIYKEMLREWRAFRSCTDAPLVGIEDTPDDAKWERFVTKLGFKFTNTRITGNDGSSLRVFVSVPLEKNNGLKNNNHKEH